jgi:predicted N-acyltransferase
VEPSAWDALAGGDNPFVEHAFLRHLETSGSVGPGTGWQPAHLLARRDNQIVGAAPVYLKGHSLGEYVFDWDWADAAARAGIPYYPKLVVAVPFTPASGPRLLANEEGVRAHLAVALQDLAGGVGASGVHVLLPRVEEVQPLAEAGFSHRLTHQYHWHNRDYGSFDEFLAALRATVRKQIRRERRRVREQGFAIELWPGNELSPGDWHTVYRLYMATGRRKWGEPYLTREFFNDARQRVGHRAVVVLARREGAIVAASLSFEKGRHLYGRYWGSFERADCLHFELCYYRLIEHAIASGKSLFEAGAQGEHKIKRGLMPVVVHSAHWFAHSGLHRAVADATAHERRTTEAMVTALAEHAPFRAGGGAQ